MTRRKPKVTTCTSLQLVQIADLFYPVIVAQLMGEISEAKAAELVGKNIEDYRWLKTRIARSLMDFLQSLPSPLTSLLELIEDRQKSSTDPS
jgi:hypothetical protein